MPDEFLKWAASLGVGGVLAAFMFWVYHKDAQATQARMAEMNENTMRLARELLQLKEQVAREKETP